MKIIINTKEQIDKIRLSCKLAAKTLEHIEKHVVPGISTEELNNIIEKYIYLNNAKPACLGYGGFPKSCCTSINNQICHGIPNKDVFLKNGDIIKIDVATILDGYYGDTCKTFPVGEISPKAKELIEITKKCLEIGIEEVKPGNYFGNIGYKIRKFINKRYGIVKKLTGHTVGSVFHGFPPILHDADKDSGPKMAEGMVFSLEPMINEKSPDIKLLNDGWTITTIEDDSLSCQFEHSILVTPDGHEILTKND